MLEDTLDTWSIHMPGNNHHAKPPPAEPRTYVEAHLCVPESQTKYLPKRRRAPHFLPPNAPLPRMGEVIYLSSSSAWGVGMVVHQWLSPQHLRVEVWLEHVTSERHMRPTGFALTQ